MQYHVLSDSLELARILIDIGSKDMQKEEKEKVKELKASTLPVYKRTSELITYLREKGFDYDKIDEAHKRTAYEILLSLVADGSLY